MTYSESLAKMRESLTKPNDTWNLSHGTAYNWCSSIQDYATQFGKQYHGHKNPNLDPIPKFNSNHNPLDLMDAFKDNGWTT